MVVFLHVVIALLSIGVAGLNFFRPTRRNLHINYGLMAVTLGTGLYLVVMQPAHMMEACISGVAYLAIVTIATTLAKVRLARLEAESHTA